MQQPITIYITQQSFHLFGEQEGGFCRSDAYSAVAVAKKVGSGSWAVYNIFRGHLGTITHLKNGSTINEYSFDAWGRRRDKDTWGYTLSSEPALFAGRGFTAHEHLEDFKLVNMNGRLYDPVVGRFLSPDENLQMPGFTQNFNRYSYALNNPLVYTDPNGESFLSALASGLSFGLYGLWQYNNAQKMGYNGFQSYLYAGGQTAIAAASAYLGSVVQIYGAIPSALFQSSVNVISNGLVNTLNKDPFFENWESGVISAFVFAGIQYTYNKMQFYTISQNSTIITNSDGTLIPSSNTLNKFSDEYFPKFKYRNKANLIYKEGYVERMKPKASAFTKSKMVNGKYNIYFSKKSFSSKWSLYLDMGHEYIHISHMLTLGNNFNINYSEYAAYKWNYRISKSSYFNDQALKYFKPTLKNQGILSNVIKPKYMRLGDFGIFDFIPKGLY